MKVEAEILRDLGKVPSLVTIKKGRRKIKVEFDPQKGFNIEGPQSLLPTISEVLRMIYPVQTILSVRGLNWFDRNPESDADSYAAAVVPHTTETRLTYICPADKIAMVEILQARVLRDTAATAVGYTAAYWAYTKEGGSSKVILGARINTNTVGDMSSVQLGTTLMLFQGDKLEGVTFDASTDGKIAFHLSYKLTEFDA